MPPCSILDLIKSQGNNLDSIPLEELCIAGQYKLVYDILYKVSRKGGKGCPEGAKIMPRRGKNLSELGKIFAHASRAQAQIILSPS